MKRKVVVKVCSMNGHKSRSLWCTLFRRSNVNFQSIEKNKSRSKALKVVVGVTGVESASLKGQEMDQIEVTGDDIDAVTITTLLRKKVGFSEIVTVAPVEEKKASPKTDDNTEKLPCPNCVPYGAPAPYYVQEIYDGPACCSIM